MGKYLISTCETYRVNSESAAAKLIEEAKNNNKFLLAKYTSDYKEIKSKGEVIDSFYKITLVKQFTSLKEPDCTVSVEYNVDTGYFPDAIEKEAEDEE